MEIIGLAKPDESGNQNLICRLKEVEADKITGIAGKPHTPHRYKAGAVINLDRIYNKVKYLNEKMAEIIAAATETEVNAAEIKESFPLEG
jgi:hypothetical protein